MHSEVCMKYTIYIVGSGVVGKVKVDRVGAVVTLIIGLDAAWVVRCFDYFAVDRSCRVKRSVICLFCVIFFDSWCVLNLRLVWVCFNFLILAFINYNWGAITIFSHK